MKLYVTFRNKLHLHCDELLVPCPNRNWRATHCRLSQLI